MSKVTQKTSPSKVQAKPIKSLGSPSKAKAPVKPAVTKPKAKAAPKAAGAAGPKKRERKVKSNAPKRPVTAYINYLSDNRQRIKEEHPGIIFTDIPRVGAQEWAVAKPAVKAKYEALADKDKLRYAKAMETYVPDPSEKKKKREKKDPNAPKKAKTAYIFYATPRIRELHAAHPEKRVIDITPMIGKEWQAMSDKQKKPWHDMAAKDKIRYANETKM